MYSGGEMLKIFIFLKRKNKKHKNKKKPITTLKKELIQQSCKNKSILKRLSLDSYGYLKAALWL